MPYCHDEKNPRCDVCGRFLKRDDMEVGAARHVMLEPDSDLSSETWETLCPAHNPQPKHDGMLDHERP